MIEILNAVVAEKGEEPGPEELKTRFSKLFSGKLGCIEYVEVKLDID